VVMSKRRQNRYMPPLNLRFCRIAPGKAIPYLDANPFKVRAAICVTGSQGLS